MESVVHFIQYYLSFFFIADPPKVRLSLGSNIDPEAISEGNDIYMDCEIRANPRAYKVEWSHNVNIFTNNLKITVRYKS